MRCLALAQAWKKAGGEVWFQSAELPLSLKERLVGEGMETLLSTALPGSVDDATELCEAARRTSADWLVVDGYQFGSDYQRALREAGQRLLVTDDLGGAGHYHANIVLNQNGGARAELYSSRQPDTELLLGPKFALLRREFSGRHIQERSVPTRAGKLLVTFGGADPHGATLKAVRALEMLGPAAPATTVLMGGAHPSRKCIEELVAGSTLCVE